MKHTAEIVVFAGLLVASVYGLLGSAVGLAQASAPSPHAASSIHSVVTALVDQPAL